MILIVELWISKFNFIRQAENIILRVLYVWLIGTWILRRLQKILGATYLRMERCDQKSSGPPRVMLTGINISLYVVLPSVFFVTTFVILWESLRSNLLALDRNDSRIFIKICIGIRPSQHCFHRFVCVLSCHMLWYITYHGLIT